MKNYDQQMKDKGFVFCKKHPEKWFDPTKFTACYYCYLEAKWGEDWREHIGDKTPGNKEGYASVKDYQESEGK